jgi:hypothetical protein
VPATPGYVSVSSSPTPSVISIDSDSTIGSEITDYPPSFDEAHFQMLDTTSLHPTLQVPGHFPADILQSSVPTPTPSPQLTNATAGSSSAPVPPTPSSQFTNATAGSSSAPAPQPTPATHITHDRWYVVTAGSRVGVFNGW